MRVINELFDDVKFSRGEWPEDIMYNEETAGRFLRSAILRDKDKRGISLKSFPLDITRKSVRSFCENKKISVDDFSKFFNILRSSDTDGYPRFTYPSAGGLYPTDLYVYIKKDRVDGFKQGIYKYLPLEHSLEFIKEDVIPVTAHYYNNRNIFRSSAFSVFLFYRADASFPKYYGMGLYYGILDSGIILGQLTRSAHETNMGSCIIGDLNYEKIRDIFGVGDDCIYLNCIEVGYPDNLKKEDC